MDIRDIILKLDPGNDDHWTAAGLPSVGAVSEFAGEGVSRQQIGEAYPGYNREKANDRLSPKSADEPPAPDVDPENMPGEAPEDGGRESTHEDGTFDIEDGIIERGEAKSDDPYSEDPGDGLKVGKHDDDPDAIQMIEEALNVAQGERYMRNYDLQNFVRQWQIQQTAVRESQRRIDARNAERKK